MSGRDIAFAAFTDRGFALADRMCRELGGTITRVGAAQNVSLRDWTQNAFSAGREALVFVGAVGIAVRATAPYLRGKAVDAAVVAVDEAGRYAVPIASGHLGGANDLAREIAGIIGAEAVITTATDLRGAFAVDEWARHQGCAVTDPGKIKLVSARLLRGETIRIYSRWPLSGCPPRGVCLSDEDAGSHVRVDAGLGDGSALTLVPKAAVLGVGCRRGISREALEDAFSALCRDTGLWPGAIAQAATIDLKAAEPGLLAFCASRGWPLAAYSSGRLMEAQGSFSASEFVREITGADNVCERSAVLASGGTIWAGKHAGGGITMAVALRPISLDWRWHDA